MAVIISVFWMKYVSDQGISCESSFDLVLSLLITSHTVCHVTPENSTTHELIQTGQGMR